MWWSGRRQPLEHIGAVPAIEFSDVSRSVVPCYFAAKRWLGRRVLGRSRSRRQKLLFRVEEDASALLFKLPKCFVFVKRLRMLQRNLLLDLLDLVCFLP